MKAPEEQPHSLPKKDPAHSTIPQPNEPRGAGSTPADPTTRKKSLVPGLPKTSRAVPRTDRRSPPVLAVLTKIY